MNAPASWPKSSDSISSLGNAAQLSFSSGPFARGLSVWIARATSSLPVPRSPVTSTLAALLAARPICSTRLLDRVALPDEIARPARGAPQIERLGLGARQAQGRVDRDEKRVGVEGLLEEVQRAHANGTHGRVDRRVPAHHDDGRIVLGGAQALEKLDAVPVGEHHVEEAEVVGSLLQLLFGDLHAAGDVDRVPLEREGLLQRRQDGRLVVDDEKVRERHLASVAARAAARAPPSRVGGGHAPQGPPSPQRVADGGGGALAAPAVPSRSAPPLDQVAAPCRLPGGCCDRQGFSVLQRFSPYSRAALPMGVSRR